MPVSAEEVFTWHERPGAFERLTPPWEKVKVLEMEDFDTAGFAEKRKEFQRIFIQQ